MYLCIRGHFLQVFGNHFQFEQINNFNEWEVNFQTTKTCITEKRGDED